jgi:hypothetical protein
MSVSGQQAITDSMKKSISAYKAISKLMNPQAMQRIMAEYSKESTRQEMMREITDETMDEALGNMGDEEEEDALVQQVLQEIGVQVGASMGSVPNAQEAQQADDELLKSRLNNL